ncbi:MAG: enoyl-CoA hydratase [Alphaproteobacteria bacterium]|nr:enoyl-CoA hydratase [Alphaproteobacteria bacterium]
MTVWGTTKEKSVTGAGTARAIVERSDIDGIATITLNRPEARNTLSRGMMAALQKAIDAIAEDSSVKVVVIAAGGPAFCAGHDLKEMRLARSREVYEQLFNQCSALMQSIIALPKPVIARVHATATAAGLQLVATCDLAVAANSAKFATPGVNIGLFCSTPMVALSRNVSRKHAMELLLTGDMIDASTAAAYGLVNRAVADSELDAVVYGLARKIASKSPLTLKIGKKAFYQQIELPIADAYRHASRVMTENMLARDADEGIDAFIEKRAPTWEGR